MIQQEEADDQRSIAHACHNKGFACCQAVYRVGVPEPDEKITAESHAFPAKKKQKQVVAQKQRHHRGNKEVHVSEKAAVALVVEHELSGVPVNEEADEGHHQGHEQRERIQIKSDARLKTSDIDPRPESLNVGVSRRRGSEEASGNQQRGQGGQPDRPHANDRDGFARQARSQDGQHQKTRQWQRRY